MLSLTAVYFPVIESAANWLFPLKPVIISKTLVYFYNMVSYCIDLAKALIVVVRKQVEEAGFYFSQCFDRKTQKH